MPGQVASFNSVPEWLVKLLAAELPYSLPLLRRLQSTKFKHGTSPHARVVFVHDSDSPLEAHHDFNRFTAAYLDFSRQETQMYIYSTLEQRRNKDDESDLHLYEQQLARLVSEVVRLRKEYGHKLLFTDPDRILVGSLHSKIVVSRTDIPRTAEMLVNLPNLMIKRDDGTPIAWALLGTDGSLVSVHCEEPYRRRGLAKKLATKLLLEKSPQFGDDGWLCADVSPSNESSRAMCKSLNGKPNWLVSWICLILSEVGLSAGSISIGS
ncbi:hypothetical protein MKX07_005267 [Trichoderma sp. CBMAI-0711]|uniref:N-acetyltransferase domain-containing protein n=1 Tax=Trichoderma parareesei TaxID=858221 RepID=A0A2H2YWL3_TRIPA|nr:hypothetical protein MKX07_005267 [Trichoderma sp. CBMAI-0711]OTA00329.1 hypothetical protein A9Z42_0078950 [Trichoderma parareesei]